MPYRCSKEPDTMNHSRMITVNEALQKILENVTPLSTEEVLLDNAIGRTLAEDVIARDNLPPFDNSSMDGYAVRSDDLAAASESTPIQLNVQATIPAGMATQNRLRSGEAYKIMTGAPLPPGADSI